MDGVSAGLPDGCWLDDQDRVGRSGDEVGVVAIPLVGDRRGAVTDDAEDGGAAIGDRDAGRGCDDERRRAAFRDQLQVEAQVGAGGVGLMDFDGDDVRAVSQDRMRQEADEVIRLLRGGNGPSSEGSEGNASRGHIAAEHLGTVQIDHGAVIPEQSDGDVREGAGIGQQERSAKICRGMFRTGVGAKADDGGFRTSDGGVAIAQFGGTTRPCGVVEGYAGPVRSLIDSGVEVSPDGASRNQPRGAGREVDGDRHHLGGGAAALQISGNRLQRVTANRGVQPFDSEGWNVRCSDQDSIGVERYGCDRSFEVRRRCRDRDGDGV